MRDCGFKLPQSSKVDESMLSPSNDGLVTSAKSTNRVNLRLMVCNKSNLQTNYLINFTERHMWKRKKKKVRFFLVKAVHHRLTIDTARSQVVPTRCMMMPRCKFIPQFSFNFLSVSASFIFIFLANFSPLSKDQKVQCSSHRREINYLHGTLPYLTHLRTCTLVICGQEQLLLQTERAMGSNTSKYMELAMAHNFIPITIETENACNELSYEFVTELGRRIAGSHRRQFLFYRLFVAVMYSALLCWIQHESICSHR